MAPCTNDLQVCSSKVMSSPLPCPWVRLLLPTSLLEPAHFVLIPHSIHLQNGCLSVILGLLKVTRRWGSCFKPSASVLPSTCPCSQSPGMPLTMACLSDSRRQLGSCDLWAGQCEVTTHDSEGTRSGRSPSTPFSALGRGLC